MRKGWATRSIGTVASQVKRAEALEPDQEYRLLGVRWYAGGPFAREAVTQSTSKAQKLFLVQPGDFIYNRLFAWKGSFGVIPTELAGSYVSGEFPVFVTDRRHLLPEYLFLYMSRPGVWDQVLLESTGSTATSRNRWKEERFLSMMIDLPSVEEQNRIVDLIASIDTLISPLHTWIGAGTRMGIAADQRLSDQLDNARMIELGEVSEVASGVTKNKRSDGPDFVDVPYLRVANVQRGYLDLREIASIRVPDATAEAKQLQRGDVLFNEGGDRDKLGRGWVWEGEIDRCIHQNHVLRARLISEAFNPYFISLWGNSRSGQRWFETMGSQTTNLASLNLTTLRRFPIPDLSREEQNAFVETRLAIRNAEAEGETLAQTLAALRARLLHDLLSGEHEIPNSYDRFLEAAS